MCNNVHVMYLAVNTELHTASRRRWVFARSVVGTGQARIAGRRDAMTIARDYTEGPPRALSCWPFGGPGGWSVGQSRSAGASQSAAKVSGALPRTGNLLRFEQLWVC